MNINSQFPLIEDYLNYNHQRKNLYFFTIDGNNYSLGLKSIDFFASSHTVPMDSLKTEDFPFGKNYYSDYEPIEDFEISFLLPDTSVPTDENPLHYFMKWLNQIYDFKNKCYRVLSDENIKYRNARLLLLSADYNTNITSSLDSPYGSSFKNFTRVIKERLSDYDKKTTTDIQTQFSINLDIQIENLMPLGLGDIEVDDSDGEPIEATFSFVCEGVSIKTNDGTILKHSGI
jgi:hypothetical protein